MKLFIDTALIDEIEHAHAAGFIAGVTTNPSLIARSGEDLKEVIQKIVKLVRGPVSAEVMGRDAQSMIEEGEKLAAYSSNVVIKVPMTWEGLKAVSHFSSKRIATNVTLVFSANQALMAARAGASYVSPFVGRLDDISHRGMRLIEEIATIFSLHEINTEIIAASIRNPLHVTEAALCGAHIATIPFNVFEQMVKHPLTAQGIEKFESDAGTV